MSIFFSLFPKKLIGFFASLVGIEEMTTLDQFISITLADCNGRVSARSNSTRDRVRRAMEFYCMSKGKTYTQRELETMTSLIEMSYSSPPRVSNENRFVHTTGVHPRIYYGIDRATNSRVAVALQKMNGSQQVPVRRSERIRLRNARY